MRVVSFTLNGKATRLTVDETRMLLWVLRDDLGLTGTKFGCGQALCGACTVLVNNEAVQSCATPVGEVDGKQVVTIEGLASGDRLHPIQ
jgi:aerobic-type carbon monoxide dehydrogenase small subunit (CoxS/CutS family)